MAALTYAMADARGGRQTSFCQHTSTIIKGDLRRASSFAAFMWLLWLLRPYWRLGSNIPPSLVTEIPYGRTCRKLISERLICQRDGRATVTGQLAKLNTVLPTTRSAGTSKQLEPEVVVASLPRRYAVHATTAGLLATNRPAPAVAEGSVGLRARLARRNLQELKSPIFNIPPRQQTFPEWLEGTWLVEQRFVSAAFPVLAQETVIREEDTPGFKVCSIIDFADVGKPRVIYESRYIREQGVLVEDLPFSIRSSVSAHLGGNKSVTRVDYMPEKDPNRWSLAIRGSKNAERVEVFVNARDSESPPSDPDLFFSSEYRRQVTFSSRVLQGYNGNYQHFKIYRRLDKDNVRLNVITASYFDPLSPKYFETVDKPVVVFRHQMNLTRSSSSRSLPPLV